jgi:predicted kinase
MRPKIIIFTGLPGTGKTTLSQKVAKALNIPLIAKDDIKEIMFDKIGWSDKAFSAKLAHATFSIMDYITEQHLKTGSSIILESNYSPKLASEKFRNWQRQFDCAIVQIVCQTDIDVLAHRYADRAKNGERHPGHLDNDTVEIYRAKYLQRMENGEDQPLDAEGVVRIVDTTDFNTVNTDDMLEWIRNQASPIQRGRRK